ncbi:MarR family winged helix-turn-helix transcriptional regulator [Syntrophomonas wolfei]|nr:MarR family transcriptional regulator [Syntrophomonas wolfei]
MIKSIKENEGIHVTGLADLLEVTKGAVSQIVMRLEKKGMVVKDKDDSNQSKLVLKLTPKGETAYVNHEKLHQEFDDLIREILKEASPEHIAFLTDFLDLLDNRIDDYEKGKSE